jgi:hypothetical protein
MRSACNIFSSRLILLGLGNVYFQFILGFIDMEKSTWLVERSG